MQFLLRVIAGLPLPWVHRLGAMAGWVTYMASPTYRRRLRANLAQALGAMPRGVLRAAVAEAGRQALELPWVLIRPRREVLAQVMDVQGQEWVDRARAAGRGVLFLTPHLGCFEITAQYLAQQAPITVLYRPPRKEALRPVIEGGRTKGMMRIAPADLSGVRKLVQALRKGEAVGMLPDQVPSQGEGQWAPFFDRPAWTMTLAARLSEVKNTETLCIWAQRLPRGTGYCIRIAPPESPLVGSLEERVVRINQEMERMIRACPAQYLWGYNRYKRPSGVERPVGEAAPS
ncbi:MAG: lysophospholipid acyltransferase family protein [Zoogloeaceae bacterium]|nr:lysophospholipid acyltransferase family protein [Zoogloeaceae bacterium]